MAIAALGEVLLPALPAAMVAKTIPAIEVREQQASTFLGCETALPHARLPADCPWLLVFGRFRAGVPWGANGEVARLVFLTVVPAEAAAQYLGFVRDLGRVVRNEDTRRQLLESPDETAVRQWLQRHLRLA